MQMTSLIDNVTSTEIRIGEGRWDLYKIHHTFADQSGVTVYLQGA